MQAHYGLDLRMACYGPEALGVRRLLVLLKGLPGWNIKTVPKPEMASAEQLRAFVGARYVGGPN